MNTNGEFAKYFDDVDKRLDVLTEEGVDLKTEVVDLKETVKQQQATQVVLVNNVEKLVDVVTVIANRLADFEVGSTGELARVGFNQQAHTLHGRRRRMTREATEG